jgi:hypothetical protein
MRPKPDRSQGLNAKGITKRRFPAQRQHLTRIPDNFVNLGQNATGVDHYADRCPIALLQSYMVSFAISDCIEAIFHPKNKT